MSDGLASIVIILEQNRVEPRSRGDDDVKVGKYLDKPICASHMWQLTRGICKSMSMSGDRRARRLSIAILIAAAERNSAAWLRERICGRSSTVCEKVNFCSHMYRNYLNSYQRSREKTKD